MGDGIGDAAGPASDVLLKHLRRSFEASADLKRETVERCGEAIANSLLASGENGERGWARPVCFGRMPRPRVALRCQFPP